MKILHVITSLDRKGGGPPEAVRILIRNRPHGFENHVLTLDNPGDPSLAGIPFPVYAVGHQTSLWLSKDLIPWLKAHRHEFDGVVLHGLWGYTSIGILAAIAGHVPYVVFPHGMLDPYFRRRFPLKHIKKWLFWIPVQYWVLRRAVRVLFTATLERELAEQSFWMWRWDPMVVSYGADPPQLEPQRMREAFYAHLPHLRGQRFLLYLSRIHPKKGCDLLMQAFAQVPQPADGPIHVVMAGPVTEDYRAELERTPGYDRVASRVHWPGMLTGDAKWGAFLASEAFILPSHQENFGIAIAEALSCGRPALITDKINIAPAIQVDGCGMVETDTLQGITRLLERWYATTPEDRERMSAQAIESFAERFDMKKNTRELFKVFQDFAPTKPAA